MSPEKLYDVIIVGAGISGLYTAKCLDEEGLDVLVIEARDRVGGRAWTKRNSEHDYMDMGGAYFGSAQTEVLALIKQLGLETYKIQKGGDTIMYLDSFKTRYREDTVPMNHFLAIMDLNNVFKLLDTYSQQVPWEKPWEAARATEWDNISLGDFLTKRCWTRLGYELTSVACQTMYASLCCEVSLLAFLWEIRNAGGVKFLFSSQEGAQEMKVKGGSNGISERMAEQLKGKIQFGVVVRSVEQTKDMVYVTSKDDIIYKTKKLVIAMCPPLLQNVDINPPLPPNQQCFVDHLPEGGTFKTVTFYDKPYWESKGLRGEFISNKKMAMYGLPDTKPDGSHPSIMSFVDRKNGRHMTKEQRKRALAAQYADMFDCPELLKPIDYDEKYWGDEDTKLYSGTCVFSFPPGLLTKYKSLWGQPHGSIFFAGVEATTIMHGYMDGGIRAGERAAKQVLDSLAVKPRRHYRVSQTPPAPLKRPLVEKLLPSVGQFYFMCALLMAIPLLFFFVFRYS